MRDLLHDIKYSIFIIAAFIIPLTIAAFIPYIKEWHI
jgi:hypothetical protein